MRNALLAALAITLGAGLAGYQYVGVGKKPSPTPAVVTYSGDHYTYTDDHSSWSSYGSDGYSDVSYGADYSAPGGYDASYQTKKKQ